LILSHSPTLSLQHALTYIGHHRLKHGVTMMKMMITAMPTEETISKGKGKVIP
jgi:hypothetical protein